MRGAASLAFAALSYELIEKPFLQMRVNTTVALFVSAHAGVACASSTGILEAIVRANERRQAET